MNIKIARNRIDENIRQYQNGDYDKAKCLDLSHCNLNDLKTQVRKLSELTWVEELNLSYNKISDIAPLANLSNLTTLHLKWNKISNLAPLANLSNLTTLNLEWDSIHDPTSLADLNK